MIYKNKQRVFFMLFIVFLSCKKDKQADQIPNVSVSVNVYLNLPSNSALNSIGNYVKVSGGYRGIIVYRRSQSEFVAFDLACPYDPSASGAILQVDSSGVALVDYHCGSRFNLGYGTILNGPATISMKEYNTDYDGNNIVYVYN